MSRMALVPLFMLLALGFLALQIRSLQSSAEWVDHTDVVIGRINTILRLMIDEETGLRGYLLTGKEEFLEPYNSGRGQIDERFAELKQLVSDNPPQVARLQVLEREKDAWAEVATRRLDSQKAREQMIAEAEDAKHRMDHIRQLALEFRHEEEVLRIQRRARSAKLSGVVLSALVAVGIVAAGGTLFYTTRLERSRRDLQQKTSQLEALLAALPIGVTICDAQGKLIRANAAAEQIWGASIPLVELWQYHQFRGYWPETQEPLSSDDWGLARALKTGDRYLDEEIDIVAFDGKRKTILNIAVPIFDKERRIVGGVAVNVDITDRKQAEQALIRAEKLSAIGRLASSMAHEINNPLAAALNSLYLVTLDSTLGESTSQYVEITRRELERVSHITRQTLGFYRETGKPAKVEVQKIVESVVELYAPKLKNKEITVDQRFSAGTLVFANEGELRQIVSNLVSNSIDAVGQGGRIRVRAATFSIAGGDVLDCG